MTNETKQIEIVIDVSLDMLEDMERICSKLGLEKVEDFMFNAIYSAFYEHNDTLKRKNLIDYIG
ncbi:hypothetical protein HQ533_03690 [Candidatus Woesearchaeota archaeon]|nr:hypothetical protein [Candidatus Woesearchaeota archaeon]